MNNVGIKYDKRQSLTDNKRRFKGVQVVWIPEKIIHNMKKK